jgi:opacity protein-like surface antigen
VRNTILTIIALAAGSPALAAEPYVGIDIGSGSVRASDVDETVVYTSVPAAPGDPSSVFHDDVFSARYKRALDVGVAAGFDFGWFRIEGELANKRAAISHYANDDAAEQFLSELNSQLNRPSQAPDPGAPGLPALTLADFQPSATLNVASAMVNALLDVPVTKRLNLYAGVGVGRSFARGFDDRDGALARQRMAGVRYAVSDRIDIGLKYRKFESGIIKLIHDPIDYPGNPNQVGGTSQTRNAAITPDIEGEIRTRAFLLSLTYNFR